MYQSDMNPVEELWSRRCSKVPNKRATRFHIWFREIVSSIISAVVSSGANGAMAPQLFGGLTKELIENCSPNNSLAPLVLKTSRQRWPQ